MDHSSPSSSVHEILQARILQWVAMPSSRGSYRSTDQTLHLMCAALAASLMSLALVGRFFTTNAAWKAPTYGLKSQLRSRSLNSWYAKAFRTIVCLWAALSHFVSQKPKVIFYIVSYYDPYRPKIMHTFDQKGKIGQIWASIKIKSTSVYFQKISFLNWCFRNILLKKMKIIYTF